MKRRRMVGQQAARELERGREREREGRGEREERE